MKLRKTVTSLIAAALIFVSSTSYAGNSFVASGEASEDLSEASVQLASASALLSAAGIYISGESAIAMGSAVSETVINTAKLTGAVVDFSGEVLLDGLVTTAQLSADLTSHGVQFSADSAAFARDAAKAGIQLSQDSAEAFLIQTISLAAASGRLSGEAAQTAIILTAAGVAISADGATLVANAGKAGVQLSEDVATGFINASLAIGADCIEAAVITERYIIMTLAEANKILEEAADVVKQSAQEGIRKGHKLGHSFSRGTVSHLRSLGIDSYKFAEDITSRVASESTRYIQKTIQGTDDAIVVVINTGSGLIVATLDSLTTAVENETAKIK